MKYKVGDKVRIKSLDWYNKNKDKNGVVVLTTHLFTPGMSQFCGKVMTIEDVFEDIDDNVVYYMEEIDYDWTDEMIEGLVEETNTKTSKYKIGDLVRIKNNEWYENNKDERGDVICGNVAFFKSMQRFCGRTVTIIDVDEVQNIYTAILKKDYFSTENHTAEVMHLNTEMIKGLMEEEFEVDLIPKFGEYSDNEPLDIPTMTTEFIKEHGLPCPEGYIFKDENGNVINATKIVLEKKKKYLKTYEECCKILDISPIRRLGDIGYKRNLINNLEKLLVCRDAYWKFYGEEMGLGKPWEPDWNDGELKWCMSYSGNYIEFDQYKSKHHTLAFPTEEMRDAFKENFKSEIESCKELL